MDTKKVAAITAAVINPYGTWSTRKGFISLPENKPVVENTVFYWASAGKMLTGIVTQQLILEKKLSLTDNLSNWYPAIQYAEKITIKQLLNHTSGLYSFNSDLTLHYSHQYYPQNSLLAIALKKVIYTNPGNNGHTPIPAFCYWR